MYLIDLTKETVKIRTSNEIVRTLKLENLESYLEEHRDCQFIICSDNIDVNQTIAQNYINVKVFDHKQYSEVFKNINDNILELSPRQILRAIAVINKYNDHNIIVNLDSVLTIDVYNNGEYGTGSIFPSFESLFASMRNLDYPTQKFNHIDEAIVQDIPNQIGKGIVNGYIGALSGMLKAHLVEYPWIDTIIFTGDRMRDFIQFYGKERLEDELGINFEYANGLVFEGMEIFYSEKQ